MIASLQQVRGELERERGFEQQGGEQQQLGAAAATAAIVEDGSTAAADQQLEDVEGQLQNSGTPAGQPDAAGERAHERSPDGISSGSSPSPIDIRDLTWEEKERVLRLLFARISAHAGWVPLTAEGR